MVNIATTICCLALITATCTGLELTLDLDTSLAVHTSRSPCGVLRCVENFDLALSTPGVSQTTDPTAAHAANISSMSVYRNPRSASDNSSPSGDLVAALTLQRPRISQVTDAIKADGFLRPGKATLQLEMWKQADCLAEYTCELKAVDADRKEIQRSMTLMKHPEQRDSSNRPATVSMAQLVILVQQMDSKLSAVGRQAEDWHDKMASLEDAMKHLERRVDEKSSSLENSLADKLEIAGGRIQQRLEDKIEENQQRLEDKIGVVGDKVVSLEHDVEEKLGSLKDDAASIGTRIEDKLDNHIVEKLCQLDVKITSIKNNSASALFGHVKKGIVSGFVTLEKKLENGHEEILTGISVVQESLRDVLNTTQMDIIRPGDQLPCRSIAGIINETLATSSELTKRIGSHFASLDDAIQTKFEQVEVSMNTTSTRTLSTVRELLSQPNTSPANANRNMTASISMSPVCKKGMNALPPEPTFPYPVIQPSGCFGLDFPYLCDPVTDGGGWIIIQRRTTGDVYFSRDWSSYKEGFGSLSGDFWLGNDKIHAITNTGTWELRVDLQYEGKSAFAHYATFRIENEASNYAIKLGKYDGTAGDSLAVHNGKSFSTFDKDNDSWSAGNCGMTHYGGWWFDACDASNLNGKWGQTADNGVEWDSFTGSGSRSVSYSEMKIRQV